MVGCYDLNACSMSSLDDLLNDLIACENFNVNHIDITCLSSFDIDICIDFIFDSLFSAFLGSTECHKDRKIAEDLAESLHYIFKCSEVKYVLEPVDSPLNNICRKLCDCTGFFKDSFLGNTYDRNADLRHSFADNSISYFNSLHLVFPFC